MPPIILYRPQEKDQFGIDRELVAMVDAGFHVTKSRVMVPKGSLVIGRYSVLPFYKELDDDLNAIGSKLINSYREHLFIADLMEWAPVLKDLTPRTWDRLEDLPDDGTAFVVKGQTNSRKDRWNTHMFAPTKRDAVEVTLRLQEDSLIQTQKIYYREYVELWNLGTGLNGLPITEEFRFFVLDGRILTGAFYWSSHVEDIKMVPQPDNAVYDCVITAVNMLKKAEEHPRFLVIDVARKASGQCIVIELNDGQMSGLSENNPALLYTRIREVLESESVREAEPASKAVRGQ
jgi:hypothetical protein